MARGKSGPSLGISGSTVARVRAPFPGDRNVGGFVEVRKTGSVCHAEVCMLGRLLLGGLVRQAVCF